MIHDALWIVLGGSAGALSRWLLALGAQRWLPPSFPWGTLVINVLGCFLVGAWLGLSTQGGANSSVFSNQRLWVTGFLGAFTTFSAFTLETLLLVKSGAIVFGLLNIFTHWFFPLLAAAAGLFITTVRH